MILITGGRGGVGSYLLKKLQNKNVEFEAPTREELDLSNLDNVKNFLNKNKSYSSILHLAAETDVDLCERDLKKAYCVNFLSTEEIARYAANKDIHITFISTSAVFGKENKMKYSELDIPNPLNLYGHSKLLAEQAIQRLSKNYLIIRSSWMIGGGPSKDNKFISKILPLLKNNSPAKAVGDKWGSLTYGKHLADFIIHGCNKKLCGTVHFASLDSCTRFDIANFIKEYINSTSVLSSVDSSMFPLSAPRPTSETLFSVSNIPTTECYWKDIIKDYLKEWL